MKINANHEDNMPESIIIIKHNKYQNQSLDYKCSYDYTNNNDYS